MNIPKNPVVRVVFLIYVLAWIVANLTLPAVKSWGIGLQLLSVFGVALVIQIVDFELELRDVGRARTERANFPTTLSKPAIALFAALMYGVPMVVAIANIREGLVDGGVAIIAILHYFVIYFAWVGMRLRKQP
jgi:ABC-type antimicrobial peptide transport system permease subunit